MSHRIIRTVGLATVATALLGGCATTGSSSRYAYYRVPCNTPGAVVAEPALPPPAPANAAATPTCVVAVANSSYRAGYGPYAGGAYGRPYYGSVGIGIGQGSHHGFGGGHFGGGHSGGHPGHH